MRSSSSTPGGGGGSVSTNCIVSSRALPCTYVCIGQYSIEGCTYFVECICIVRLMTLCLVHSRSGRHKQEDSLFEEMLQVSQAVVSFFSSLSACNCALLVTIVTSRSTILYSRLAHCNTFYGL